MRILVADDDADLLGLLRFSLLQSGFEVSTARDGAEAIAVYERDRPDFALLDVNMPELDGLQVCRQIRSHSSIPIIVLTARNIEDDLVAAVDSGADDFLGKPFSPRIMLARIRALIRRSGALPATFVETGLVRFDAGHRTMQIGAGKPVRLTPLEVRMIELLLNHAGRTVITDRMTQYLWGHTSARERRTLKQLIYRLRHKLEVNPSAPQILLTTAGAGYRFVVETDAM